MLNEVKYTSSKIISQRKEIEKRLEKLGITNKELLEVACAKLSGFSLNQYSLKEFVFLQNKDFVFFNSSRDGVEIPRMYTTVVNTFVPEKEYIEQFFREYLGVVATCSRLLISIPSFGQGIEKFSNIVFIMNSLISILNESNFKIFFKYTNYKEFCDNIFLNLLYHKLYDSNRQNLIVTYFILLMKDFSVRDLLISEQRDGFSTNYRHNPENSLYLCFSHCSTEEEQLIKKSLVRGKEYLHSLITNHWQKETSSNLKRSITAGFTWLCGNL